MYKRPITYQVDGETITKNFYFNLNVDEVAQLELDMPGGLSNYWLELIEQKDAGRMLRAFKDLIAASYGERDGEFFLKETESGYSLGRRFLQHPAYSVLFLELLGTESDDKEFSNFLKAVVPASLSKDMPEGNVTLEELKQLQKERSVVGVESDSDLVGTKDPAEKTIEDHSRQELLDMSDEDFDKLVGVDSRKWSSAIMGVAFERKGRAMAKQGNSEG